MAIFGVQLVLLAGLAVLVTLAVLVLVLEGALERVSSQRHPIPLAVMVGGGGSSAMVRRVTAELLASTPQRAPPPPSVRARETAELSGARPRAVEPDQRRL